MLPKFFNLSNSGDRDIKMGTEYVLVQLDSELEYLSLVDESGDYHESRAVFSGLNTGVEVKIYSNFELYEWTDSSEFNEVLESVEPLYPLVEDPAIEMIKEEGLVRNSDRDHDTISNELVYDPVREWRNNRDGKEGRWSEYSLIQLNLNGAKVVWDRKNSFNESRIRVYQINDNSNVFENLFPELVDDQEAEKIVEEVSEVL